MKYIIEKLFLGVDPGGSGAMVCLNQLGEVAGQIRHGKSTDSEINDWLSSHDVHICCLEKVSAFPGQGVSSTFKFGVSYGKSQGFLIANGVPFEFVTPHKWQKSLSIKKRQKSESQPDFKRRLKGVAQRLFPDEKIVLDNADAFLIAEYCRQKHAL